MGEPSKKVRALLAAKVTRESLCTPEGGYLGLHEKVVLELAEELHYARTREDGAITPWNMQREAMDYFNEHGFIETLNALTALREKRE